MELLIHSTAELDAVAQKIIEFAGGQKVLLFYGPMGAGKTTLIKSLCKELGTTDNITSPTFAIVNEYQGKTNKIYHFDFYRLKQQSEAMDLGFEEYLYSGNYSFIEWPEMVPDLLPDHYIQVKIAVADDGSRQFNIGKI